MQTMKNQATHIAITICIVVLCMTVSAYLVKADKGPLDLLIFMAGTVGGVVNNFRRMQKISLEPEIEANTAAMRLVTIQIYVSPIAGGVFAFVLYVIFMTGFLQGTFFPAFECGGQPFTDFQNFARSMEPATQADVAKAILWAFIAGFSEGFVPNFIDKLAKEAVPDGSNKSGN